MTRQFLCVVIILLQTSGAEHGTVCTAQLDWFLLIASANYTLSWMQKQRNVAGAGDREPAVTLGSGENAVPAPGG